MRGTEENHENLVMQGSIQEDCLEAEGFTEPVMT